MLCPGVIGLVLTLTMITNAAPVESRVVNVCEVSCVAGITLALYRHLKKFSEMGILNFEKQ